MTIAELRNAPAGTSQYLDAQLLSIGLAKVVNLPQGPRCVQECQVIDQQGQKEKIAYWFDADKPNFAMPIQQVNQWMRWKVKTKPKGQYLNIGGYPEKQTEQPQQQSYTPPPQGQPQQQNYTPPPQAAPPQQQPAPPPQQTFQQQIEQPAPENYKQAERKKVLGMCFTNLLSARLAAIPATEIVDDIAELQALSSLSAICIDGIGGQPNPGYSDNPEPPPQDEIPY